MRLSMKKSLPSPSGHVDERVSFTLDKVIQKKADDKDGGHPGVLDVTKGKNVPKQAPKVALYNQNMKRVSAQR